MASLITTTKPRMNTSALKISGAEGSSTQGKKEEDKILEATGRGKNKGPSYKGTENARKSKFTGEYKRLKRSVVYNTCRHR